MQTGGQDAVQGDDPLSPRKETPEYSVGEREGMLETNPHHLMANAVVKSMWLASQPPNLGL